VAWKILAATGQEAWKDHWLALLERFQGLVPSGWEVLVLADRGLYAKGLFEGICTLGWHPLLRIKHGGKFRPHGWYPFVPLASRAPVVGSRWRGRGTAFATARAQLEGTLLAFWGAGHAEAWLVLTDLPPQPSDASWYGLRSWIEQFFKDGKRGGWQWPKTRMTDPARAERLGLGLAVASLGLVRVSGADEVAEGVAVPELRLWSGEEQPRTRRWRLVRVFARGWVVLVAALINHERLPRGGLVPEPWPLVPERPEPTPAQSETKKVA
jgi:hypothetical protein